MSSDSEIPTTTTEEDEGHGFLSSIMYEIMRSPVNVALVGVIALLVYKIWKSHTASTSKSTFVPDLELPKMRRDFTLQELRPFDGTQEDGRVLVAVNGSVYDVTKGKRFYGPGQCFS